MNRTGVLDDHPFGVTILQHPQNPNGPEPWILRDDRRPTNMQNSKWLGRAPVLLSVEKPVVLRYRLLIHRDADPAAAYAEYLRDADVHTSRD